MSLKQIFQRPLATDFSHPLPLTRLNTSDQFLSITKEPHEAYLSPARSDLLEDLLHKLVVLILAIDKRENCVNSVLRGFLYHLQPIFVGETPEGLCSKLENRLDKLDRDMIMEKLEPGQLC